MVIHRFRSSIMTFVCTLFLLILPGLALAQESDETAISDDTGDSQTEISQDELNETPKIFTAKDNFGGWKFGADLLLGAYFYTHTAGKDPDADKNLLFEEPDNSERATINAIVQVQASYLWGNNVFFGPVLNVSTGLPIVFAADLRLRLLIPLGSHKRDAVSASAGWGIALPIVGVGEENILIDSGLNHSKTRDYNGSIDSLMYFPIEMTYEHVFDNRFVLGASIQLNINKRDRYYYTKENNPNYVQSNENSEENPKYIINFEHDHLMVPVIGALSAGVHLGYKF